MFLAEFTCPNEVIMDSTVHGGVTFIKKITNVASRIRKIATNVNSSNLKTHQILKYFCRKLFSTVEFDFVRRLDSLKTCTSFLMLLGEFTYPNYVNIDNAMHAGVKFINKSQMLLLEFAKSPQM